MKSGHTVTLTARLGTPLRDPKLRDMVEATARAIAERQGVVILDVECDDDRILVTVDGERLVALGLVAELRRVTERWHSRKYGVTLWGDEGTGT